MTTYNGTRCTPGEDNVPGGCCCGLMAIMEKPNPVNDPGCATSAKCGRCGMAWKVQDGRWIQTDSGSMTAAQLDLQRRSARELVEGLRSERRTK